jgi:predicted Rossmann-fold nucleotide-binding protein
MGYARNVAVVKSAQAVIAIDGSFGTLSEIGHALQNGIPVVGLNTWSLSRNGKEDKSIILAQNPAEAVNIALDMLID